jgi:N-acetylneuraminate synthase
MPKAITLGDRHVGGQHACFIVAEIGINHNGDIALAKKLIDAALDAGCDAVKFQKRTIAVVYTPEELAKPRENPFGPTNGDLKRGLEFGHAQYLTDDGLLRHHRKTGRPLILSTGMSTLAQVDHAVEVLGKDDLILLHTNSTYPSKLEELNIRTMLTLAERYGVPAGYSGHEVGLAPSVGAAAIGACMLERHITVDRAMWGSDQAASIEPQGFARLVRDVRAIELSFGDGVKRVYDTEVPILKKLRRKG